MLLYFRISNVIEGEKGAECFQRRLQVSICQDVFVSSLKYCIAISNVMLSVIKMYIVIKLFL